jgi:signal transduction histidine kinase
MQKAQANRRSSEKCNGLALGPFGIEPGQIDRIFRAFEQGGRKITRENGGLGLGVVISTGIVQAHRGTITAGSGGVGKGSTFTVALPCGDRVESIP